MRSLIVGCLMLTLSGCYMVRGPRGIDSVTLQAPLQAGKSVYVPIAPDGRYKPWMSATLKDAPGSGKAAAEALYDEVRLRQPRSVLGVAAETEEQALASARAKGLEYVFYPRVNEWTEASYWTCSPEYKDIVNVDLSVYDVASGKAIKIDRLYNGGCATRVFQIPVGIGTVEGRFRQVLQTWLGQNQFVAR